MTSAFNKAAGIEMRRIPFQDSTAAANDVAKLISSVEHVPVVLDGIIDRRVQRLGHMLAQQASDHVA